ncbi:MAG TPA: hypothetical protein VGK35_10420 [Actinotalea sp.]
MEPDDLDTPATGDQSVDAALTLLVGLDERAVRDHVGVFESVHGALADRLAETR